jgi:DNA-binding XRE family transcriptional regulator
MLGLKQSCDIYRWETGNKLPSLINALKLSAALKCPVELLFWDHFTRIRQEMYAPQVEGENNALT